MSSRTECWVGLVFSSPAAAMHGTSVRWMKSAFSRPDFLPELPDRFEERQRFDVADGAADLGDHHVHALGAARRMARLDLVGDVRNHLHRRAEVFAAALLADDGLVDPGRW